MGSFYVNCAIRGASHNQIVGYLKYSRRTAYVSPTFNGTTFVYEQESDSQDGTAIERLAEDPSRAFKTHVLAALNHDDDILIYWLFHNGNLLDDYNSAPGVLEGEKRPPDGGDPEILCRSFEVPDVVPYVRNILSKTSYTCELERHFALGDALRMPREYLDWGFNRIEHNLPLDRPNFIRIG